MPAAKKKSPGEETRRQEAREEGCGEEEKVSRLSASFEAVKDEN